MYCYAISARTDLVIRATDDRGLVGGITLADAGAAVTWQGTHTVEIPGNGTRVARTASVSISTYQYGGSAGPL